MFQATFPLTFKVSFFQRPIFSKNAKQAVGGHLQGAGSKAGDLANKAVVRFSTSMLFFFAYLYRTYNLVKLYICDHCTIKSL